MSEHVNPEATDPTPGEVGLSDFQQLGSEIHRFRCTNPDCRHYSDQGYFTPRDNDAASAILASDWLATREREAEQRGAERALRDAADFCEPVIAQALGAVQNDFADGWRQASAQMLDELRARADATRSR